MKWLRNIFLKKRQKEIPGILLTEPVFKLPELKVGDSVFVSYVTGSKEGKIAGEYNYSSSLPGITGCLWNIPVRFNDGTICNVYYKLVHKIIEVP